MKTKTEAIAIIKNLKEMYPNAKCSLNFENSFQMMVSVMLSAQCTDERVNKVTIALFKKYSTPEKMAKADIDDLESIIYPCGFYKNKAKNIKDACKALVNKYDGNVPNSMESLMSLPGVGRKSANVIMLECFNDPQGIAVDTHAKRISNRIGFSNKSDPSEVEKDLIKVIPKEYFFDANHLLVEHGRNCCKARKPDCKNCKINIYCDYNNSRKE